ECARPRAQQEAKGSSMEVSRDSALGRLLRRGTAALRPAFDRARLAAGLGGFQACKWACGEPLISHTRKRMKRHTSRIYILAGAFLGATALPCTLPPADSSKTERPKIYDESADGSQQINDALTAARKEHEVVLLQFGANWCGWCHKLH